MFQFEHIRWLDDRGYIRPPLLLYLLLAFLGRGWLVFVASLSQLEDRTALVRLFYPQKESFLLALVTGLGAVFCYLLVILERKIRPWWAKPLFVRLTWLLWPLLMLDAAALYSRLTGTGFLFSWAAAADAIVIFWFALYLTSSRHLRLYLSDWQTPLLKQ